VIVSSVAATLNADRDGTMLISADSARWKVLPLVDYRIQHSGASASAMRDLTDSLVGNDQINDVLALIEPD
jgi:hypothetical protein